MAHTIQDMKSALSTRVDVALANKLYSESRDLGQDAMCPAGAHNLNYDVYGRPVGIARQGILLNDAACSKYVYPASKRLLHESAERPYIATAPVGLRGGGDTMFGRSARDHMPRQLYNASGRGDFVRHYANAANQPPHQEFGNTALYNAMPPSTLSMDATSAQRY